MIQLIMIQFYKLKDYQMVKSKNLEFVGFPYHKIYENRMVQSIDRVINTKDNKKRKLWKIIFLL